MSQHVKQHAWYLGVASVIASLLGALTEQNVIPAPWNGVAVAVGMLLASLMPPPGTARQAAAEDLLSKRERQVERRSKAESVPPPEDP